MRWTISQGWLKLDRHAVISISDISPQVAAWFIEYQPKTTYKQFAEFTKQFKSTYECLLSYYNGVYGQ